MFAEINAKGERVVTSSLKKVSKDQMTHKNPNLRASSVVPDKAGGVRLLATTFTLLSHSCSCGSYTSV